MGNIPRKLHLFRPDNVLALIFCKVLIVDLVGKRWRHDMWPPRCSYSRITILLKQFVLRVNGRAVFLASFEVNVAWCFVLFTSHPYY